MRKRRDSFRTSKKEDERTAVEAISKVAGVTAAGAALPELPASTTVSGPDDVEEGHLELCE
jgi:hypothetical protein